MRWYLLAAVVFGLSKTDVASHAQGPPAGQRLGSSRSTPQDAGFFATAGVVRFQMVQGRLCLDPPRHRKGSQSRDKDGVYESITVTAERGIPSLHYIFQTSKQHLTLSVQQARNVRIESFYPQTGERSVLEQSPSGAISWTVQRGDLNETHLGTTLLHIRQHDETSFDSHHGELMPRLLRGRSIRQVSLATRDSMLHHALADEVPDLDTIAEMIDQLRSPRRAKRIAAERQLIQWGTPIIPVIEQVDLNSLDPEQRDRLAKIKRKLRVQINDTAASLALLLINDQDYWSLLAPRLSGPQLQLANRHLKRSGMQTLPSSVNPDERIASAQD